MIRWSTPDDIAARVRRRWDDGSLLRAYAAGEPFPVLDIPIRGPRPSEIGDDLVAVRDWVSRLDAGRRDDARYTLEWTAVGGRSFGRNRLPARARVADYQQAWRLLGVAGSVREFDGILAVVSDVPRVRDWIVQHPHQGLALAGEWPRLLGAYAWLDRHRGSGKYLREIAVPGVDTKFAERHRAVLASLLEVSGSATGFVAGLGLGSKPELMRLRCAPGIGLPAPLSELAVRTDELAQLPVACRRALVVENEISYLSVAVPEEGVVLWGKGFEVDRVGRLPWLADADMVYWGDLDTHGFAILDRLRAWLPQTRSVLMDRETLVAHQDRWVVEQRPATSRLRHLTSDEQSVYADLVGDVFGPKVRLEQERIDWDWTAGRLDGLFGSAAAQPASSPADRRIAMNPRVQPLHPRDLMPEQSAVYQHIADGPRASGPQLFRLTDDEGRLNGPFDAMLRAPGVGDALQALGAAIRYRTDLSARVREMAILAVASHGGSEFERYAHEPIGRAAGLTDGEIRALRTLPDLQPADPAEHAALDVVRELLTTGDLSDTGYDRASAQLDEPALVELTALVGYYTTLAMLMRVFRVPTPASDSDRPGG